MNVLWAAWGGVAGYLLGAALRGTVFQLAVPSGQPDRTTCPQCSGPVRAWLPILCERCGSCYGTPFALEVVTGTVLALLLGRFGIQPDTMAFAYFGVLGVALSAIDIAVQRLPDRLTLPGYPILIAMLAVPAVAQHDLGALLRSLLGGLALVGGYLLLALVRPGHMGGGDIKLAGLAGLVLGWLGWPVLIAGAVLAFFLSALISLGLLAARRVTLRSTLCFGPFLVGGALLAMLTFG
jgi:leader peptidase (prepilin peptidase) / N-methyltransferase